MTSEIPASDLADGGMDRNVPLPDFSDWFVSLLRDVKPDLIVGIARGALRLFQVQDAERLLGDLPLLSQHAIPFLSDVEVTSKRMLLFDDSVIFGSVMSRLVEYAESRGAKVFCAAYAVDRENLLGESHPGSAAGRVSPHASMTVRYKHKLWPAEIRRHHAALVGSVLRTTLDYNPEFPSFRLSIGEYLRGDVAFLSHLLRELPGLEAIDEVSTPASTAHGIHRYTALIDCGIPGILKASGVVCRPYSKVRLSFAPRQGEIRITPIIQLSLENGVAFPEVVFCDKVVESLWRKLKPPSSASDQFYHQSLLRLLTSFSSLIAGEELIRAAVKRLMLFRPVGKIEFLQEDARLILGAENAKSLSSAWLHLRKQKNPPSSQENLFTLSGEPEYPNAANLREQIIEIWQARRELRPRSSETICERVGKILLALQHVTDRPDARLMNPTAARLDVGLNFEAVRSLLEDSGPGVRRDDVSLALDACIDSGLAVPRIIHEGGRWFRAFYCGEDENDQALLLLKRALHRAYSDYLAGKAGKPLSRFDIHKLCACLKDLLGWLPISTKFNTYGRFATIGDAEIIDWLCDPDVGPMRPATEGKRQVLLPDADFVPAVEMTWPAQQARDFFDAFQFTATAFLKVSDEAKLLISTCRTHRYTFNAVAYEAARWSDRAPNSFGHLTEILRVVVSKKEPAHHTALADIFWSIEYLSEAFKKHHVFHNDFAALKSQLEKSFVRQGGPGAHWWDFIEAKRLLDPTPEPSIEGRFALLRPLLRRMCWLTVYCVKVLEDLNLLSATAVAEEFERHGVSLSRTSYHWFRDSSWRTAAREWNAAIDGGLEPGRATIRTKLPIEFGAGGEGTIVNWANGILAAVAEAFRELAFTVHEHCPHYKVGEGELPFAPDSTRRLLPDGSVELDIAGTYVLTLDIIGSTDSLVATEFKEVVCQTFRRYSGRALMFDETRNDAFVACCDDPLVLWEIAKSLSSRAAAMIKPGDRFMGSRKGLSYGPLTVVEKITGGFMVGDHHLPHLLPRAFTMLNGVDKQTAPSETNSLLFVESKAMGKCEAQLKVAIVKTLTVSAKHFTGDCAVLSLA